MFYYFAPLQALGFPEGYKKGVEEFKPIPSYSQGLIAPPDQVWQIATDRSFRASRAVLKRWLHP